MSEFLKQFLNIFYGLSTGIKITIFFLEKFPLSYFNSVVSKLSSCGMYVRYNIFNS